MRNSFYGVVFSLLIVVTLFNSCQKEVSPDNTNSNKEITAKVNSWLESQKAGIKQFKAENIELLKNNLDYSNLRIESSAGQEQIVIIPITEKFKAERINDKNTIPYLVLVIDKSGNIRKGNVVLFKPDNGTTKSKVPDNTFHDILNTGKVNSNGLFQFLSIAGQWKYQLRYKDGNLISFGLVKPKNDSNTTSGRLTATTCTDWYLVTTYYYEDGSTEQTSDYVGTTCSEDCGDGTYASVCSDLDGGSGGGGGNDVDYEFAVNKQKTWTVASNSYGLWSVVSTEQFAGILKSSEPGGGHFTGASHLTSSIINSVPAPDNFTWTEFGATTNASSQSANSTISGKVTTSDRIDIPISKTNTWSFSSVFP